MTYTIVTADGTLQWREDIFATKAEADEFITRNPFTPSGNAQLVVTTEEAREIAAQVQRLRVDYELQLDAARRKAVGVILGKRR